MEQARTCLFCYGLDLNLTLLHCIVGGPKPRCHGRARLVGYTLAWSVLGHLPTAALAGPQDVLEGALTRLDAEQRSRLETSRLVPALYQWRRVVVTSPQGRSCWAQLLWAPQAGLGPGSPNSSVWGEVVIGALERGLPAATIEALLALRPQERRRLLGRWGGPWPRQAPRHWLEHRDAA